MCKKKPVDEQQASEDYKAKYCQSESQNPYLNSWLFGTLFFSWVSPVINIAKKTSFEQDMHYKLPEHQKISVLYKKFDSNWSKIYAANKQTILTSRYELKKPNIIYKALWSTYQCKLFVCFLMSFIFSAAQYVNSYLLYQSLKAFKKSGTDAEGNIIVPWEEVGVLMACLIISKILLAIFDTQLGYQVNLLGVNIRNVLCSMVMQKSLRKSVSREREYTSSDMLNLTGSDAQKFSTIGSTIIDLFVFPFSVILGITYLWWLMGLAVFPAIVIVTIVLTVNYISGRKNSKYSKAVMSAIDDRLKVVNECFTNVRYVKMTATENFFLDKMCEIKKVELGWIGKNFRRMTMMGGFNRMSPIYFMAALVGFKN
jgi:ABC-type multidrug transport system fused ATPase/permease subunit